MAARMQQAQLDAVQQTWTALLTYIGDTLEKNRGKKDQDNLNTARGLVIRYSDALILSLNDSLLVLKDAEERAKATEAAGTLGGDTAMTDAQQGADGKDGSDLLEMVKLRQQEAESLLQSLREKFKEQS